MRRDNIEVGNRRGASGEGLPVNDRSRYALLWFDVLIMRQQYFGTIRLTINVNQEDFFALVGEACGKGNRGAGFANAAFLRSDRNNHSELTALKAG